MSYDKVLSILRLVYHWSLFESPARGPVETALAASDETGGSAEGVASRLDSYVRSGSANATPPFGIEAWGKDGMYKWFRHLLFTTDCKYDVLNARLALGQAVEANVPHEPEAKTPAAWWAHLLKNRNRLGYPLLDLDHEAGAAEWERRVQAAKNVPFEWASAGEIYQLAVLNGDYPVSPTGFYAAYAQKTPRSPEAVAGLTPQMYLDNMRCTDRTMPLAWPVVKTVGKVPA